MKCIKCKSDMYTEETGFEDGMVIVIRECENCDCKCKSWYELDDCMSSNDSWLNEKGECID